MFNTPTPAAFRAVAVDGTGLYRVLFHGKAVGRVVPSERHARIARLNGIYAAAQQRKRGSER